MKPWTDIQGWLSESEGEELRRLAPGRRVLECGTWKGRSTVCMAEVAAHVVTVDWFRGDGYTGQAFTLPDFVRTMEEHEVRGLVTPMVGDCRAVLPLLKDNLFDFVFYDGDHAGEATVFVLQWCAERQPRAVIAVHDYDPRQPQYADAIRVVDDFAEWMGRSVRVVDTLAVLELSE